MTEAKLSYGRHCSFLHTAEQIGEISVVIVVHLKGTDFGITEKYAARAAEDIYKSSVFQRKQRIYNIEQGGFVAYS